jgi:catechol 2,3-dioxygenase-like lactoylglutathione lyase family enzyme
MATLRYIVDNVDAALPFYRALCFRLTDRWGPPFGSKQLSKPIKGPGGRQVLIDDPSGNPIELFEVREG